jgi:hypothetical protein
VITGLDGVAMRYRLRRYVEHAGSVEAAASQLGVSDPGRLYDMTYGHVLVSETIAQQLGYRRVVVYVKEGTPTC